LGHYCLKSPTQLGGFTLLEVLTVMALFFMVAGILTSGVIQAIRVAEVGGVEAARSRDQLMRLAWFRETIGLTILPPNSIKVLDPPPPLVGDVRSVSGLSIQPFESKSYAPGRYRFEIQFNPNSGETELLKSPPDKAFGENVVEKAQQRVVLASWQGSEGRFRYLGDDDRWHDQWPIGGLQNAVKDYSRSQLPKAVEIRYGSNASANSVVVAIQDRALPLPSMRELMQ
jgi:type II secretory pathway pseudopilin PulG